MVFFINYINCAIFFLKCTQGNIFYESLIRYEILINLFIFYVGLILCAMFCSKTFKCSNKKFLEFLTQPKKKI